MGFTNTNGTDTTNLAVKTTQDSMNTNVGSDADASSATGSTHGKLKDVKASIGSLAVKTTQDSMNTNVGSDADASSATGSVHGKLKDIKANLGGGKKLTPEFSTGYASTANRTTFQTVLNITGKGLLRYLLLAPSRSEKDYGGPGRMRVTIDGVVVLYVEHDNGTEFVVMNSEWKKHNFLLRQNTGSTNSFQYFGYKPAPAGSNNRTPEFRNYSIGQSFDAFTPSSTLQDLTGDNFRFFDDGIPFGSSLMIEVSSYASGDATLGTFKSWFMYAYDLE